jgi:alpha-amylase
VKYGIRRPTVLLALAALAMQLPACGSGSGSPPATELPEFEQAEVARVDPGSALPTSWRDGIFMEIFVRAYQDSDGDGIGDLKGLTSRLDYLERLGVTGIWLMPIHPSQDGDHGYAVKDYRAIAPEYGSMDDFRNLLDQAHRRGIGVIVDYVINHSAAEHPAFVQSSSDNANAYRDWYVWSDRAPNSWTIYGSNPWHWSPTGYYFGGFWNQMPDFNLKNPQVLAWHQDNLRHWLNLGVDGFRFDAVGNLVENSAQAWENQDENHVILKSIQDLVARYQSRFMVCEAPSQPVRYAQPDSCGSAFAFGYQYDLAAAVRGQASAISRLASFWQDAPSGLTGFASNHDGFAGQRLADQLNADPRLLRLAAASYLLQSRRPFIYYGEEIGMQGASGLVGDPRLRTPMSWSPDRIHAGFSSSRPFRSLAANSVSANVELQETDPGSLLNFYRSVIAIRRSLPALQTGRYLNPRASGSTLSFQRELDRQRVVVLFNYGGSEALLEVDGLPPETVLQQHWPAHALHTSTSSGSLALRLDAQSFAVLSVTIGTE